MTYKISDSCQIPGLSDFYEKYFDGKTYGYFVEVGAYDGYGFSNTWGLAEAGWHGIYVEPIHELAERCREVHKNNYWVVTTEVAISDVEGLTQIWLGQDMDYPSCTIDEPSMRLALATPEFGYDPDRYRTVRTMRLDSLLFMFGVVPAFDLLVIDVEGAELKVLQGFSWKHWLPKMIIIEDHEGNIYPCKTLHTQKLLDWFATTDYKRIWHDACNSIYVLEVK